jgi:hypothetical protein
MRKQRANKNYIERKKSLKDLRKNLRNKAYASIIPIPTPLLDLANYLITKTQIGTYKIAQFADELKNLAESKGFNANDFISGIKDYYINNAVSILSENPELAENISTASEIANFHFADKMEIKQDPAPGSAQ